MARAPTVSSPTKRDALRRQVAILERLLEAGRWPSGLELTSRERDVITHNLERDRRALEEGSEP
jgi:hypothetical protein